MKKILSFFGFVMMMALFCFTFTACSSDDNMEDQKKTEIIDDNKKAKENFSNPDPETGADNFNDLAVTGGVSAATATTVTVHGYVNLSDELRLSMGNTLKLGIELSSTETMDKSTKYEVKTLENNRKMTQVVKELLPDTKYYYRTYVANGSSSVVGKVLCFKTVATSVDIDVIDVTDITTHTANFQCKLTNESDVSSNDVGVAISTDKDLLIASNFRTRQTIPSSVQLSSAKTIQGGNFEVAFKDLKQNMTYYFCAFRKIETCYVIGEVKSIKIPSNFEWYIEKAESYVISVPATSVSDYDPVLQAAFKLKFKHADTKLEGYGISVSETKSVDKQGRLVDQFSSYPANFKLAMFNEKLIPSGGFFPYWKAGGFLYQDTERLVAGRKYYYQLYYRVEEISGKNSSTYDYEGFAYDEIHEITAGGFKLMDLPTDATVDMGDGVKWRWCNLGADSPEQIGTRYAWGETDENSSYSESGKGGDISGTQYDVAHTKLGGKWRLPRKKELGYLAIAHDITWPNDYFNGEYWNFGIPCNFCDEYEYKGVKGTLVFSYNGNCLFFAIGKKYSNELYYLKDEMMLGDKKPNENETNLKYWVRPVTE